MGKLRGILLTFLLLQLNDMKCNSSLQFDKGCYVEDTHVFKLEEDTLFNISFLVTSEDPISFQISFVGRKDAQDNDLLILEPSKGTLQRKRQMVAVNDILNLKHDIPVGWNRMNVSSHGNELDIGHFYTLTGIGYKILDITVSAKYLTVCADSTPVWEINSPEQVSVPLQDSSSVGIRLVSDQPFQPEIKLFTIDIPLSYNGELAIGKSNILLPPQAYMITTLKNKSMIYISTVSKTNEQKTLMIANIEEDIVTLMFGTLAGSFKLILDPFLANIAQEISTKSYQDIQNNGSTTKSPSYEEVKDSNTCENISQSCTVWHWQAVAGLALVIAVISIIIAVRPYILRKISRKHQEHCKEEGDEGLPLLNKEAIKNQIKSEYSEAHGEVNIQMGEHAREICKLKLKNENDNTSKKIIEKLDDSRIKKVILVIGQTGSGKSSFINAMVNFIYGISYEDAFRFKLIDDMDAPNVYGTSNTSEITAYCFPYMAGIKHDYNYIFIDTPGFSESGGIDEDKKWNQKFYEFLNTNQDIGEIDGICFVVKATNTRLTVTQKYIIEGLFSKFGKDIKNSIYIVVSYSDGSETHVGKLLKKSGLNSNLDFTFNSNGLYNDKIMEPDFPENANILFKENWMMNMKGIDDFFKCLRGVNAISLSLTSVVLEENKDINKIRDDILKLMVNEEYATDQEKQEIQSRIEQNQEILMIRLDEAQKLSGRLENIPAKKNPLVINEYIDMLIKNEQKEEKILELKKLKKRNTAIQRLLKDRKSPKSIMNYIFGEKTEKTE